MISTNQIRMFIFSIGFLLSASGYTRQENEIINLVQRYNSELILDRNSRHSKGMDFSEIS